MAEGPSAAQANAFLDSLLAAHPYVQMHIGAPGAAGTANIASNSTRKLATWTSAVGGVASNSNELLWSDVPASEDYTKFSCWSALTGGTFGLSGTITANAVVIDDDFVAEAGSLTVTLPVAS